VQREERAAALRQHDVLVEAAALAQVAVDLDEPGQDHVGRADEGRGTGAEEPQPVDLAAVLVAQQVEVPGRKAPAELLPRLRPQVGDVGGTRGRLRRLVVDAQQLADHARHVVGVPGTVHTTPSPPVRWSGAPRARQRPLWRAIRGVGPGGGEAARS
jgi:hypothetical protein